MTPKGREILITAQKRLLDRQREITQRAIQYAKDHNGRLDNDFESSLLDMRDRHLFDDLHDSANPGRSMAPSGFTPARRVR